MHDQRCYIHRGYAFCISLFLLLTPMTHGFAADIIASNKRPLSFGPGQTIIDLKKIVWEPLKGEGIPPGAKIAPLRGDLAKGGGELLVYLPAYYTFPNHSHTSDELYVWIQGDFTYIAEDGTATPLSGHTYINLLPMFHTHCAVGEEPVYFTSAMQGHLIIKSTRCPRKK